MKRSGKTNKLSDGSIEVKAPLIERVNKSINAHIIAIMITCITIVTAMVLALLSAGIYWAVMTSDDTKPPTISSGIVVDKQDYVYRGRQYYVIKYEGINEDGEKETRQDCVTSVTYSAYDIGDTFNRDEHTFNRK